MRDKKGDLNLVLVGIISLATAGFLLIMSLIMMDSLWQNTIDVSGSKVNESLTTVTETGELVSSRTSCGFTDFSVKQCINQSSLTVIPTTNYTTTSAGRISFTKGNSLGFNNSNWNCSYSYTYGLEACTAGNETIIGLGNFSDYIDLIALAIVITAVISLLAVIMSTRTVR